MALILYSCHTCIPKPAWPVIFYSYDTRVPKTTQPDSNLAPALLCIGSHAVVSYRPFPISSTFFPYYHLSSLTMDEDGENVFPCFKDGDVSVCLSPIKRFQLHSQVLRQNSTFFEEELGHPGARLTPRARKDGAAAFHFELVISEEHPTGFLEQRVSQRSTDASRPYVITEADILP